MNNRFIIRGTRGTLPACGTDFVRYGGHTTCFTLQTPQGMIIFDAGTGLLSADHALAGIRPALPMHFLFTHFHVDHIIGLPCFSPLYNAAATITMMGDPGRHPTWKTTLASFMSKPYWPVGFGEVAAAPRLTDLPARDGEMEIMGIHVRWMQVPHPQDCLAYRLDLPECSIVIGTDLEYTPDTLAPDFTAFCSQADFLIFDAQYTPDEYPAHRGWGHSTWEAGTVLAQRAGVHHLILTHHAPERTDAGVDAIVKAAQTAFADTTGARAGMELTPQP